MSEPDPFAPPTPNEETRELSWPPVDLPVLRRVPNLGHAALFAAMVFLLLMASQGAVLLFLSIDQPAPHDISKLIPRLLNTKLQLASMAVTYLFSLAISLAIFPRLWRRSFAIGIEWNADAARRLASYIVPAAMLLSWCVQLLQNYIPPPKSAPIDSFFTTASDVWLTALFGTLLAPLTEEIFFRGFLLPALAIAFDWALLTRSPEALLTWRSTTTLSREALIVSGLLSSGLFALVHAAQLGYSWSSVAVLLGVSLVLTLVRLKTRSVAASTLMHATYNFTIFLSLFIGTGGFRHLEKMK